MATQFPQKHTQSNHNSQSPSEQLWVEHRCCFFIPYRCPKPRPSSPDHNQERTILSRGIVALKKLREWSEIVAGPRWKTFIRRFNRNKSFDRQLSKFQYDPLGYALNFDEGALEHADSETENEYMVRNFSARYASIPVASKTSIDRGKDAKGSSFV
ncbi:hypothetical protein QVD17_02470 [Tagetes erecta]|uniref:Uncharacterized protein n=1 Tax=Tagetes erecta TaxID=13708 RepID=A0AAD8LBQ5_TARER|nr:hypothetical protein QVD17_02470 [Tagetes erecta]